LIASGESSCVCGARICNLISAALISPTVCKSRKQSGFRNEKLSCVIPIDRSDTRRRNLLPPYTVDSNKPPSGNTKLQASLKPQISAMSTQIVVRLHDLIPDCSSILHALPKRRCSSI
jgi:hypothetical protein